MAIKVITHSDKGWKRERIVKDGDAAQRLIDRLRAKTPQGSSTYWTREKV